MSQRPPAPTVQPSPPFSVVLGNTFYVEAGLARQQLAGEKNDLRKHRPSRRFCLRHWAKTALSIKLAAQTR